MIDNRCGYVRGGRCGCREISSDAVWHSIDCEQRKPLCSPYSFTFFRSFTSFHKGRQNIDITVLRYNADPSMMERKLTEPRNLQ